ncbi:MAG: DPP IV N-terminal domain-containing protein, partial [Candidatus Cryptobacteroides sp.]
LCRMIKVLILALACASAVCEEVNPTYSPDSTKIAFTRSNDLWVRDVASGVEKQLTFDGDELRLNGYASWVYYEEILGRPSRYRAFWWSPDSRRLAFYHFDNSNVPYFPIYSPFSGNDTRSVGHRGYPGRLNNTRYPKAGQWNPLVKIGFVDTEGDAGIVWADFPLMGGDGSVAGADSEDVASETAICDGYFGIPFWKSDSKELCVPTLPRIQNNLKLFSVSAEDGSKKLIYNEKYPTWISWFEDMVFGEKGLYVARRFETGWDQIYFISYDGTQVRRLTDSRLWEAAVLKVDEKSGKLYFSARIDGAPRTVLFSIDLARGKKFQVPNPLTPTDMYAERIAIADDFKSFTARISNCATPPVDIKCGLKGGRTVSTERISEPETVLPEVLPELIWMTTSDGFELPALITYPAGFDPDGKYPVIMEIYGGPDTPYVRDRYRKPRTWYSENGIIKIVCDSRAAGHNGRAGEDQVYRDLTSAPVRDFCEWADYLASLPYVDGSRIGVEGFSFGGTMTAMLVMRHPERFCCGIAGGGVYDWTLYDSHYTERFMETPQTNADGYAKACVLNYVEDFESGFETAPALLLTHGTGDDNVHFQNTLVLVDALQKAGKNFDLMIYPDGMHGYRGLQAIFSINSENQFWREHLLK